MLNNTLRTSTLSADQLVGLTAITARMGYPNLAPRSLDWDEVAQALRDRREYDALEEDWIRESWKAHMNAFQVTRANATPSERKVANHFELYYFQPVAGAPRDRGNK